MLQGGTKRSVKIQGNSPPACPWTHNSGYPIRWVPIWGHRAARMRNGIGFKFMCAKFIESVLECDARDVQPRARARIFGTLACRVFIFCMWLTLDICLFNSIRFFVEHWISSRSLYCCKYFCLSESHKSMAGAKKAIDWQFLCLTYRHNIRWLCGCTCHFYFHLPGVSVPFGRALSAGTRLEMEFPSFWPTLAQKSAQIIAVKSICYVSGGGDSALGCSLQGRKKWRKMVERTNRGGYW